MLTTGNQLKAARALVAVEQVELAKSSGLSVGTVRNMEACGANPITSSAANVRAIQIELEKAGIEFLNHGRPGVRLRAKE